MKKIIIYLLVLIIVLTSFFVIINLNIKTTNKNTEVKDEITTTSTEPPKRELTDDLYINGYTASYWEDYFITLFKSTYDGAINSYTSFDDPEYSFYITDENDNFLEVYTMKDGIKEIQTSKNEIIEIK